MTDQKRLHFGGGIGGVVRLSKRGPIENEGLVVRPRGFEPLTFCSGGKRSIQLSYGRVRKAPTHLSLPELAGAERSIGPRDTDFASGRIES